VEWSQIFVENKPVYVRTIERCRGVKKKIGGIKPVSSAEVT
jgi:hypothetical protein